MNQSKILFAVLIVAAFVAGIFLSQKSQQNTELEAAYKAAKRPSIEAGQVQNVASLLTREMQTLTGETQAVSKDLKQLNLVNFWATWCAPCREEMPLFDAIYQTRKDENFQIVGIAIDSLEAVDAFIQEIGVRYPILLAGEHGWDVLETTGNPNNLLPYTILIDQNGKVLEQKLGLLKEQEINDWLSKHS